MSTVSLKPSACKYFFSIVVAGARDSEAAVPGLAISRALIGNTEAHAKNMGFFAREGGWQRLSGCASQARAGA